MEATEAYSRARQLVLAFTQEIHGDERKSEDQSMTHLLTRREMRKLDNTMSGGINSPGNASKAQLAKTIAEIEAIDKAESSLDGFEQKVMAWLIEAKKELE